MTTPSCTKFLDSVHAIFNAGNVSWETAWERARLQNPVLHLRMMEEGTEAQLANSRDEYFRKQKAPARAANLQELQDLVQADMDKSGRSYDDAFARILRQRPDLFV